MKAGGPAAFTRTGTCAEVTTVPAAVVVHEACKRWSPGRGNVTMNVPPASWPDATTASSRTTVVPVYVTIGLLSRSPSGSMNQCVPWSAVTVTETDWPATTAAVIGLMPTVGGTSCGSEQPR